MQRGFTLIETTVAVAMLALLLVAGASFAFGSRPFAMRTAVQQFETQLQAARALATSTGNGATIVVQPLLNGDGAVRQGFKAYVYAGRPNGGPISASTIPPIESAADIDGLSIGSPPFGIFISSSGTVSVESRFPSAAEFDRVPASTIAVEPPCPASGEHVLAFHADGAAEELRLPCRVTVSGSPIPLVTNSPTPAP